MGSNRSSRRRPLLIALLVPMLGLTGALAYQAQDAARSHRGAVEAALHDYASFAAWQFARRVQASVGVSTHQTLHPLFEPGSHRTPNSILPGPGDLAALPRDCGALASIEAYFRLDPTTGHLSSNGHALVPGIESWLTDTLSAAFAASGVDHSVREGMVFYDAEDGHLALGYALVPAREFSGPVALGFVADASLLGSLCDDLFPDSPLLPPSLTGGAPNDSILAVAVTTPSGTPICSAGVRSASGIESSDTLDLNHGSLVVRATLRPEMAGHLLIGGLPASRLPLLLGLLGLTAVLMAAAVVQLRREQELARLREDFVSGVSHELRTPLAQIRMFSETLLLGRARREEERQRSLEVIDREARRLGHLVNNVLRFSTVERASARIAPEPTALAPLVRDVVEGFEPLARARQARIRLDLEPGVAIVVDRGAFEQMLLNLLDNALKYGPPGQTVSVTTRSAGTGVQLVVDDQGPGIPRDQRDMVWGPFHRLDRHVEDAVSGSGIGLAVVRELAAMHSARATVEDAPDGGARFVIEFLTAWRRLDDGVGVA